MAARLSNGSSNRCLDLALGGTIVTPFETNPSCLSSDRRSRLSASRAAQRIAQSQRLNWLTARSAAASRSSGEVSKRANASGQLHQANRGHAEPASEGRRPAL